MGTRNEFFVIFLISSLTGCTSTAQRQELEKFQVHQQNSSNIPKCSSSIVQEFISGKVLDKDGLASTAGIKGPSSSTFVVGGVLDASKGAVNSASGNFLAALMPNSARLSEIDHLAVVLSKSSANSKEEAIAKMRVDITEVTRDVVGAKHIVVDDQKRSYSYYLTGGNCTPIVCKIHVGFLGTKSNQAKLDDVGNYVFSTTFGVTKDGTPMFMNNHKNMSDLARGLGDRGYVVGFWSAQPRIIYSENGEPCRVGSIL